jgi:AcrR family transcriptional regulator
LGYQPTNLKAVAEIAGVTVAAIYNYCPSKMDLFNAASQEATEIALSHIRPLVDAADGFVEKLSAFLDGSLNLYRDKPSMAKFVSTTHLDSRRYDGLHDVFGDPRWREIQDEILSTGLMEGEFAESAVSSIRGIFTAVVYGLSYLAADSHVRLHSTAIEGFRLLFHGDLINADGVET